MQDLKKRKEELEKLYRQKRQVRENALKIAENTLTEMLRIEGAFQELNKLTEEDKPNEKKNVNK